MANANFFSPDGGITRYPLEDTEGRTTYEEEVHGINLLKNKATTQTINGVTFTVNTDGSIKVNGTATATVVNSINLAIKSKLKENEKYILSGCPSGGAINKYKLDFRTVTASLSTDAIYNDIGEGVEFTLTSAQYSSYELGVSIRIENGFTVNNLTFYPMLIEAKYAGIPYRPYNQQSIQNQINDITGVTGVRNLLENINTTYTEEGATWTVNSNKTVTINKPNASTNQSYMRINYASDSNHSMALDAAPYIGKLLKASFLDSAINGIGGRVGYFTSGSNTFNGIDDYFSTSKTFTVPSNAEKIVMYLRVDASVTISNVTVKPMIRLASDPDDTYVPYAMTNRELTEVTHPSATFSGDTTHFSSSFHETNITRQGNIAQITIRTTTEGAASSASDWVTYCTLPFKLHESLFNTYNYLNVNNASPLEIQISTDGVVKFRPLLANKDIYVTETLLVKN